MKVRVRLAPSPTGPLHVGTARTALFNFLFARKHGGQFILRIEDTDRERSRPEYEREIMEGLQWLELHWDEGPDVGGPARIATQSVADGPHAPYRQSERGAHYQEALDRLLREGKAYEREGAVYFRVDVREPLVVRDLVRGEVSFPPKEFTDFVIARPVGGGGPSGRGPAATEKSDLVPTFHLAVVVDDAAMEITHVIRGEDHLSNTPKHLLLQRALGLPTPQYAHLPLLLDTNRKKLSKRTAETGLLAYRDRGYLPEAMVNFLALLGWNPKTTTEVFTLEELAKKFDLAGVQKGGAVFDTEKLDWLQRQHLQRLPRAELADRAAPFLNKAGMRVPDRGVLERALAVWQERGGVLADFPRDLSFVFREPELDVSALPWRGTTVMQGLESSAYCTSVLEGLPPDTWSDRELLQKKLLDVLRREGKDLGTHLWPTRYELTGEQESPDWSEIAWVLGRDETLRRLHDAQKRVSREGK